MLIFVILPGPALSMWLLPPCLCTILSLGHGLLPQPHTPRLRVVSRKGQLSQAESGPLLMSRVP